MSTIPLKKINLSVDMMTADQITSYVTQEFDNSDYTAFEVFPTFDEISAGTVSDVVTDGEFYLSAQAYQVGNRVLNKNTERVYSCIKALTVQDEIEPGVTQGWEEYWNETQEDYHLRYINAVPPQNELSIRMYIRSKTQEECNVIVDFGDGTIVRVSDDDTGSVYGFVNYGEKYGSQDNYSNIYIKHTYQEQKKFIVKIYGRDYFMVRNLQDGGSLVSRVFDRDLPIAQNYRNASSLCLNSLRLLKVNVPYEYDFKNLANISFMFSGCKNLQRFKLQNGTSLRRWQCFNSIFNSCENLDEDIGNIQKLFTPNSEEYSFKGLFKDCHKIYGTVNDRIFWNNDMRLLNRHDKGIVHNGVFSGCELIAAQVPVSWGGTASEDLIRKNIDEMNVQISSLNEDQMKLRNTLGSMDELMLPSYNGNVTVDNVGSRHYLNNDDIPTNNNYSYKGQRPVGETDLSLVQVLKLGSNNISVATNCFANCLNLEKVDIAKVGNINANAFSNNSKLVDFHALSVSYDKNRLQNYGIVNPNCKMMFSDKTERRFGNEFKGNIYGLNDDMYRTEQYNMLCGDTFGISSVSEDMKGVSSSVTYLKLSDQYVKTQNGSTFQPSSFVILNSLPNVKHIVGYGILSVGDLFARDVSSIMSVDFPNAVQVGVHSFNNTQSNGRHHINYINMPNLKKTSVTSFGSAFSQELTSVCFPELELAQNYAFTGNKYVKLYVLPKLKTIGMATFSDSSDLLCIDFGTEMTSYPNLNSTLSSISAIFTSNHQISCYIPNNDTLYNNWMNDAKWNYLLSSDSGHPAKMILIKHQFH